MTAFYKREVQLFLIDIQIVLQNYPWEGVMLHLDCMKMFLQGRVRCFPLLLLHCPTHLLNIINFAHAHVCVCVQERERERERGITDDSFIKESYKILKCGTDVHIVSKDI
jgi:hypothetical protein